MSGFMNSNFYLEIFGGKDDPKPPEKPKGPAMFSGLAMKKTVKAEGPVQSTYTPPVSEIPKNKRIEPVNSYVPPDPDRQPKPQNSLNDSIESTENTRSQEDPFADIKFSEETKTQKASKIPGFGDDDDTESFEFVKKNKLNFTQKEVPKQPIENFSQQPRLEEKKNVEIPKSPEMPKSTDMLKSMEMPKSTEKNPASNKVLKNIEEKMKKEAEDKERKEAEERKKAEAKQLEIDLLRQKEERERLKKEEEEKRVFEKFGDPLALKELVGNTLKDFSSSILEKINAQEGLKDSQKILLANVTTMQARITELEELEDQAAYNEDFEEAARLHEELEQIKEKCKVYHELIQSNSAQYSQFETEKHVLIQKKKNWIEETFETSTNLMEKIIQALESEREKTEENWNKKKEELDEKNAQNSLREQEMLKIKASVSEQKTELDQRIYEKSSVSQIEEKKLSLELADLNSEIQKLEELLVKKKSEAVVLSKDLGFVQESLAKNMKEFEEETYEVEEAEKIANSDLEQIEKIKLSLQCEESESQLKYEEFLGKYSKKTSDLEIFKQELDLLSLEIKKITRLQESRSKFLTEIAEIEKTLKEKDELLWDAQEYYSSNKEGIDQFKDTIRLYEEKIKDIDKRIPILENDKKTAASAKLFKDASRLNNKIKDLNSEYLNMKEKVQGLYKELVEKEDGLQKIEKTADEIRTDILKHQNFLEEMKEKLLYAEDTEIDDKS